jgi:release factor glutamine methyltransferase
MKNQETSRNRPWTILKLLKWTTSYFKDHGIDDPKPTAEILLAYTLMLQRIDLYLQYDRPLNTTELSKFKVLIKRKLNREPVAYIVGNREFWSKSFVVSKDVLIPRSETECLVEAAIDTVNAIEFETPLHILELGTGSGAIIVALACQKSGHVYFASDLSQKALGVAKMNARKHTQQDIHFFAGNWLEAVKAGDGNFDLILSNPPYIRSGEIRRLEPEIHAHEPLKALDGGMDGLKCVRYLIKNGWRYLKSGGLLIMEIGYDQGPEVRALAANCDKYGPISVVKDYSGHDRVVILKRVPVKTKP